MLTILFFDYRELDMVDGFNRVLQRPRKHSDNPLFVADRPWENGNMQLYGSVLRAPDARFQMGYSVIHEPWAMRLAYAESDDGVEWRRPQLRLYEWDGGPTNIVFTDNPHGPAVIHDPQDPREDWRYKMVAGASPENVLGCIRGHHSADGMHWEPVKPGPMIATPPDCPMGFFRAADGRYVVHHRNQGYGRRVFRSESWDLVHFDEPRMILEPGPGDPAQFQIYGMGATIYGSYEIGPMWAYHTGEEDLNGSHMHGYQEGELTYARAGHAWHRAERGEAFIPHGSGDEWDRREPAVRLPAGLPRRRDPLLHGDHQAPLPALGAGPADGRAGRGDDAARPLRGARGRRRPRRAADRGLHAAVTGTARERADRRPRLAARGAGRPGGRARRGLHAG